MFKKMLLLASMALAVVAVAAPASAFAGWIDNGNPIEGPDHITFSGPASFEVKAAEQGTSAVLTATGFLDTGSTGRITSVTAHDCTGTGKLAGLTCTSTFEATTTNANKEDVFVPVSESDPWSFHCESDGTILITDIRITNHYYLPNDTSHSFSVGTSILTGDIKATPDNSEEIGSVSLSSENAEVGGATATVGGELAASPAGTYGCE